jgi:hypothetical protein
MTTALLLPSYSHKQQGSFRPHLVSYKRGMQTRYVSSLLLSLPLLADTWPRNAYFPPLASAPPLWAHKVQPHVMEQGNHPIPHLF